ALGKLKKSLFWDLYLIIVVSILFGFFWEYLPQLAGTVGFEMNLFIQDYIGTIGTLLTLIFGIIIFLVFKIKVSPDSVKNFFEKSEKEITEETNSEVIPVTDEVISTEENPNIISPKQDDDFIIREDDEAISNIELKPKSAFEIDKEALKPTISSASELNLKSKEDEPTLV